MWQINYTGNAAGNLLDADKVPPKGFLYCNCAAPDAGAADSNGIITSESMEEVVKKIDENKKYAKYLFFMGMGNYTNTSGSLFLDKKRNIFSGSKVEQNFYQEATGFLKNFNMIYYGGRRLEFLKMGA